jgi:DNA invertase Pin-like site-specific DNA recombinase
MRYGYVRLAGRAKTLNPAIRTLKEAGCTTVYHESTPASRQALKRMLDELKKRDIVTVTALDQLAGSTAELLETLQVIHTQGAKLESLADPWAKGMNPAEIGLAITSIGRFQGAARAAAGAAGRELALAAGKFGRPPRLTPAQEEDVRRRHGAKEASIRTLAKEMKVGRSTIERTLRKTAGAPVKSGSSGEEH